MDAQAAMDRIAQLEDQVRALREDNANYNIMIVNYRAFIDSIPSHTVNGWGEYVADVTAKEWVEWARHQLGYYGSY
jgi:hypothetical protein